MFILFPTPLEQTFLTSRLFSQLPAGNASAPLHPAVHLRLSRIRWLPGGLAGSGLDQPSLLLQRFQTNGDLQRHDAKSEPSAGLLTGTWEVLKCML